MPKSQTTIYLDDEVKRQAKILGLNISEITERAVFSTIGGGAYKDEEAFLDYLTTRKATLSEKKRVLQAQFEDISKRLEDVSAKQSEQQKIVDAMHLSQRIAHITKDINELIVSYNFDFNVLQVEAGGLLQRLNQLRPGYFTEQWLKDQIVRVQDLGY